MLFLITQSLLLIGILILLYLLTWFLPTDSPWAPWWTTDAKESRLIGKLAKITSKDVFYELGSGTGTTILVMARDFGAKCVGIESDRLRVFWSRLKAKRMRSSGKLTIQQYNNINFLRKDFFSIDLSPASVVYLYLVPRVITKLKTKLLKELMPGTRIVSKNYRIDYLKKIAEDKAKEIYIYKV